MVAIRYWEKIYIKVYLYINLKNIGGGIMSLEITWLTMKQVSEQTSIRPATINRYKDDFFEYIQYRYNASNMLEFDSRSIPVLQKIYGIYRDRTAGRMTTEKVKQQLLTEYRPETIDIHDLTTTSPPVEETNANTVYYLRG